MDGAAIMERLLGAEGRADPYPLYEEARALGPVVDCGDGALLTGGYQEINQVLRNPAFLVADSEMRERYEASFADHLSMVVFGRSILEANPPHHTRMRAPIAAAFTARRVAGLEPAITTAVHRLLDRIAELGADGSPVDFMDEFAYQLPVGVICELLGVPEADRRPFRALASDLTSALELVADPDELTSADSAAQELCDYFTELAAERRARPQDDLVSALVQLSDADPARLSDAELLANLVLLLVAGFETTTNLLGNGLSLLFEHPDALAGLRGGSITPAGFTDEVLRFDSPVQLTSRLAGGDGLRVGGREVPAGSWVLLLIGAANRDPVRYPYPDRFDPARKDSQPLSFGAGPHFCLGSQLARLEAALSVPALLNRFPRLAPAGEPTRRDRLVLRGYQTLPVTVR